MKEYHTCAWCSGPCSKRAKTCGHVCDQALRSDRKRKQKLSMPTPHPVSGARWLPLTRGHFALIDEDDFADTSQMNWCLHVVRGLKYAVTTLFLKDKVVTGKTSLLLHRYLLQTGPNEEVDHRDGDGLNNRRENLRIATSSENKMNAGKKRSSRSKFKGVSWYSGARKWVARIVDSKRRRIHLGSFDSEKDAALAYSEAAKRLHGEWKHSSVR